MSGLNEADSGGSSTGGLARLEAPREQLILLGLMALATLGLTLAYTGGAVSSTLDDAYIYQRYASRVAAGHGLSYVDGVPATSGATSVPYLLALLPPFLLGLGPAAGLLWAQLLGFVSLAVTLRAADRLLARSCEPSWRRLGVILLVTAGPLYWALISGMDTLPFAAALTLAFERTELSLRAQPAPGRRLALLVLALARPEGLGLALLLATGVALSSQGRARLTAFLPVAIGGVLVASLVVTLTGRLGLAGGEAKFLLGGDHVSVLEGIRVMLRRVASFLVGDPELPGPGLPWIMTLPMTLPLATVGLACLVLEPPRPGRAPALTALGGALTAALLLPFLLAIPHLNQGRYHQPLLPLLLTLAVLGMRGLLRGRTSSAVLRGLVSFLLLVHAARSARWLLQVGRDCQEVQLQHVRLAGAVDRLLPPDAVVALNDAGVLAVFGGRRTVDLVGLTSPDFASAFRRGPGAVYETLVRASLRPTHFAGYPDAFTGFQRHLLEPVMETATIPWAREVAGSPRAVLAAFRPGALDPEPPACGAGPDADDELDLAAPAEERAHQFRLSVPRGRLGVGAVLRALPEPACGGAVVRDGGYPIYQDASLRVRHLTPGRSLEVTLRYLAPTSSRLLLMIDGGWGGEVELPATSDSWGRVRVTIPGERVTGSEAHLELVAVRPVEVFHLWARSQ